MLRIVGVSGSGKSTLLARIWSALAAGPVAREGLLFVRFVGSTSASRDLEDLLSGLCADIDRADPRDETLPTGVDALAKALRERSGSRSAAATGWRSFTSYSTEFASVVDAASRRCSNGHR